MTTKESSTPPQRMKNQAAIDLLEQWLNETPTPAEIEAERKSLAEIMAYLMKPDAPQSERGALLPGLREALRITEQYLEDNDAIRFLTGDLKDAIIKNAAPQVTPSACHSDAGSAQGGSATPAAAASLLSGNPEFYSSPPSASVARTGITPLTENEHRIRQRKPGQD